MVAEPGGNLERALPMDQQRKVEGTVVQVHDAHHWFRVRYRVPGLAADFYETFKTADPPVRSPWKQGYHYHNTQIMQELRNYN